MFTWEETPYVIRHLAICKCAAHRKDDSEITKGNNFADKAAKAAAIATTVLLTTHENHTIPLSVLQDKQKAASPKEQKQWLKHGAVLDTDDIMKIAGKPILPKSLHKTAALVSHGVSHVSTGGMIFIIN